MLIMVDLRTAVKECFLGCSLKSCKIQLSYHWRYVSFRISYSYFYVYLTGPRQRYDLSRPFSNLIEPLSHPPLPFDFSNFRNVHYYLSDSIRIRTDNHLVRKRTPNHLTKLASLDTNYFQTNLKGYWSYHGVKIAWLRKNVINSFREGL